MHRQGDNQPKKDTADRHKDSRHALSTSSPLPILPFPIEKKY